MAEPDATLDIDREASVLIAVCMVIERAVIGAVVAGGDPVVRQNLGERVFLLPGLDR